MCIGAHLQILQDGHGGEHLSALRHMRDAEVRALVGRHREQVLAVVRDIARNRRDDAGDRLEQRGLAGAVRTDDGDKLTARDVERNAAQCV